MTAEGLNKLLMLAAAAGITTQEFRALARGMQTTELDELSAAYSRARNHLRHFDSFDVDRDSEHDGSRRNGTEIIRRDIVELARAAKLRPAEAAHRILIELVSTPGTDANKIPPFNAKEGFGRWVDRLANAIGPAVAINAAIAALKSTSGNGPRRWKLSQP
jgi:hypothetical protein